MCSGAPVRTVTRALAKPILQKVVAWAQSAPAVEESTSLHRRLFIELDADRLAKLRSIRSIESELAGPLSKTPYVLLLRIPGINVVSAAEFAGEMGPIERYLKAESLMPRQPSFLPRTTERKELRWLGSWLGSRTSGDLDPKPSPRSSSRSWPNWG